MISLITNDEMCLLQSYPSPENIFLGCALCIIRIELIKFICKK
jgi:hypothetical protein